MISDQKLTKENVSEFIEKCSDDPVYFIRYFLKMNPSTAQEELVLSMKNNQNTVGVWSRQTGKSTAVSAFVVWKLLFGKGVVINGIAQPETIIVAAPAFDQTKLLFNKIKTFILNNELIFKLLREDMTMDQIIMKNGNSAKIISASPTSNVRGHSASCLIVDECGDVDDDVMNAKLMPFLTTTKGAITKIGTPRSRNNFYISVYEDPKAHVIIQPYDKCSFYDDADKKRIFDLRSDQGGTVPIPLWDQEYKCIFSDSASSAFPSEIVKPCLLEYAFTTEASPEIMPAENGDYAIGVDLARERDSTVMAVIRKDCIPYRVVHVETYIHKPYTALMGRLKILSDHFNPSAINVDQTGEKGWGDLAAEVGIAINPIIFGLNEKLSMADNLRVLFEKRLMMIPKGCEILYMQVVHQQYETTPYGKKRFYHPSDEHDDHLWALALAAMSADIDVTGMGFGAPHHFSDAMGANVPIGRDHSDMFLSLKERDQKVIKAFQEEQSVVPTDDLNSDSVVVNTKKWSGSRD